MNQALNAVKNEIKQVLRGKDSVIDLVLCALLAKGHILLEDIPGVGKTTLAVALSRSLSLDYKRMQFTPDVLPSDILGFQMYDKNSGEFHFVKGAIFCNLFLADEINRTSPKTQSALLEVMEERRVTVEGESAALPDPFFVIATQNPFGASGTQKLPDSQLDRFFVRLSLGYPDTASAVEILMGKSSDQMNLVQPVLTTDELLDMQRQTEDVFVDDSLYRYIVELVESTRRTDYLAQGISPRGSLAVLKMAKAHAFYDDRDFLIPDDILSVFYSVTNHRLLLSTRAKAEGLGGYDVVDRLIRQLPIPKLSTPRG
ncbi:MAG: MoxR family ATPase [Muribaculaceae bacterium]|nr:MoxR family ATPase [Roseburia sp.]MCM1430860.1 MoxR family ATPase [Muribaculaceae bacterium]MCM1492839.1 MoxR family ATPase [Muribaculaceae bacterium]